MQWVYKKLGVNLPGTAAAQGKYCVDNGLTIPKSSLAPGDLVFWSHKPNGRFMNITHVGIYAGDGKVVDASSSKGQVVYGCWSSTHGSDRFRSVWIMMKPGTRQAGG